MAKDLYTLQDPTKQYPLPKFKHQPQRAPGIDAKMTPKPDHGETSYRGSGRLPNRKALVTGGRQRHRTSGSHCLCARGCGCCDQLSTERRA